MLTPAKYWRIQCDLDQDVAEPPLLFTLPHELAAQKVPPSVGHGLAIAAYCEGEQMGTLHWVGVIVGGAGHIRHVNWRRTTAQIWVDTATGRRVWKAGAFGFAPKKTADYGLHELWQAHFPELELRAKASMPNRPRRSPRPSSKISSERLLPIEVIGQASTGVKAGVVYVLKSAYGYKVGRTRNIPSRMRAFGVKLPFIYTIPLCAWFDDCHEAERHYHRMFESKRINGEWFDLDDTDLQLIKRRA